jgi:hypothetical protein
MRARGESAEPTADDMLEHANLVERAGEGAEAALKLRRGAFARFPDAVQVRCALGSQLLRAGDAEGVALIEPLVEQQQHPGDAAAFSEMLRDYYWTKGEKQLARQWHERFEVHGLRLQEARRERDVLHTSDAYLPHQLPPAELEKLVAALRAIPAIRRAYLVRKQTVHFADLPFYAFGYSCSRWFEPGSKQRTAATLQQIQEKVLFPGETLIISIEGGNKEFSTVMHRVEGARLV